MDQSRSDMSQSNDASDVGQDTNNNSQDNNYNVITDSQQTAHRFSHSASSLSTVHSAGYIPQGQSTGTIMKVPHSAGTILKAPQSAGTILNAPQSAGSILKAPHSAGTILKAPHSAGVTFKAPHSAGTILKVPHSAGSILHAQRDLGNPGLHQIHENRISHSSSTRNSMQVSHNKGRGITEKARSSTTLSSQATTDTSDEPDDHINVVLRVRPLNPAEVTRKDQFTCTFPGSGKIDVDTNGSVRQFAYNVAFEPEAIQADLFDHSGVKKLIDMALNGYACTALAFGQTGSGKTHTMTGPPQQFHEGKQVDPEMYGIIQRSLKYLFHQSTQHNGTKIIRASYLEIYNEQVIDLLNPNMRRYLQVRWSKNKGFYVENLFVVECESLDDLMAVLEEGMYNSN